MWDEVFFYFISFRFVFVLFFRSSSLPSKLPRIVLLFLGWRLVCFACFYSLVLLIAAATAAAVCGFFFSLFFLLLFSSFTVCYFWSIFIYGSIETHIRSFVGNNVSNAYMKYKHIFESHRIASLCFCLNIQCWYCVCCTQHCTHVFHYSYVNISRKLNCSVILTHIHTRNTHTHFVCFLSFFCFLYVIPIPISNVLNIWTQEMNKVFCVLREKKNEPKNKQSNTLNEITNWPFDCCKQRKQANNYYYY